MRHAALVLREFPMARRIFPEVVAVAPSVWQPVQSRRVRYRYDRTQRGMMTIQIAGQAPIVRAIPGVSHAPATTQAGAAPAPRP